ncbi:MAG TPA: NADH-quinone oxidoreductase subunit N [Humidesulfovibrio sp.]|uniref:NADH-quinone oxidoreductase subunit N n=1 Tax=Humidesulfovibrio sp. TaxID=2910988 RepID=UPI002C7BB82A|nr:NADH-quinone oxidoreductase subunit N [Humidesulfovibrio sp.]HWR04080.1 NADH-quinone oxidoreductase subunit N [Humidesulfovibrio sp.]
MEFNPIQIVPELYQLLLIVALFCQCLGDGSETPPAERWLPYFAGFGVFVNIVSWGAEGLLFAGAYKLDALSQFFKLAIAAGFYVAVLNAARQPSLEERKRPDYFMFLALSAWGLMLLSSAVELITIYIALEISSYSLYAVIPLRNTGGKGDPRAAEAGIKYILFGAVATAVALYGFSYILASQHTSYIAQLAKANWTWAAQPMAVVGLSLFMGGMFFKLALFPFHFWCPDVYQGASNETAGFAATLPKLGATVVLIRLAVLLKPGLEITMLLAVLGALSMTFGNLCALAQKDVKRLLGFSSVAHAGYIMVGLVSGTAMGLAAAAFYSLAYVAMNLLCFWVVSRVASDGRNLQLDDLNGLYKRSPALAFALGVGAFALVGLPPTMGFMGKLFLIAPAWEHYWWLVVVMVLNSAIAIFYYLSLVRHAYTHEASEDAPVPDNSPFSVCGAGILAAVVLLFGVLPGGLLDYAVMAGKQLLP